MPCDIWNLLLSHLLNNSLCFIMLQLKTLFVMTLYFFIVMSWICFFFAQVLKLTLMWIFRLVIDVCDCDLHNHYQVYMYDKWYYSVEWIVFVVMVVYILVYYDRVRYLRMFTNQPSWSRSFCLVVTLPSFGAGIPGSVPSVSMCYVTLSFLLHWRLVWPVVHLDSGRFWVTFTVVGGIWGGGSVTELGI
jgi:hypothetical protein